MTPLRKESTTIEAHRTNFKQGIVYFLLTVVLWAPLEKERFMIVVENDYENKIKLK